MSKRLFIGSLLNTDDSARLFAMKDELGPKFEAWWNCSLRWVKPEKLHLTWLFLGDCDSAKEKQIIDTLNAEMPAVQEMTLKYESLQFIGSEQRPNAMVLLPVEAPTEVKEFGKLLRDKLGTLCQNKEDLGFLPHVTMFRMPREHKGKYPIKEELDLSNYLPYTQAIKNVALIESHFGTGKSGYKVLAEHKLANK